MPCAGLSRGPTTWSTREAGLSNDLETLKRHTAELQAALNGISESAAGLVYFRTELEHTLRVLRQANHATEPLRQKRRLAAFAWALVGGLLGGIAAAWLAFEFLGR